MSRSRPGCIAGCFSQHSPAFRRTGVSQSLPASLCPKVSSYCCSTPRQEPSEPGLDETIRTTTRCACRAEAAAKAARGACSIATRNTHEYSRVRTSTPCWTNLEILQFSNLLDLEPVHPCPASRNTRAAASSESSGSWMTVRSHSEGQPTNKSFQRALPNCKYNWRQ